MTPQEATRKEEKIKAMAFDIIVAENMAWGFDEGNGEKFVHYLDGINSMTDRIIEEIRDEAKREKAKTTPTENK